MRYNRFITLCSLLAFGIALYAQEDAPQVKEKEDDPYKELYELKKKVDAKESEITKLQAQLEQANNALTKEKESNNAQKIKALQKHVKELQKDSVDQRKKSEKEATGILESQKQLRKSDSIMIDSLKRQVAEFKKELNGLTDFKQKWLSQMAGSVDEKWLTKSYSQIDIIALKKDCDEYARYADTDANVKAASDKLSALYKDVLIYNEAVACVSELYDADRVKRAKASIKGINANSSTKSEEIQVVSKQMDDYEITVEIFIDVIKAVDDQMGDSSSWPLGKAAIDYQESENEYITAIQSIPWLKKQYEIYSKPFYNESRTEDDINAYKEVREQMLILKQ